VFLLISTHLTAPPGIPLPPTYFNLSSIACGLAVEPQDFTDDLNKRLRISLRPVNPDNACTPRITDASGTWLAGTYSSSTFRTYSSIKGVYDPRAFILHATSRRQAFAHCARFLIAASRRSLGRVSVPVWPSVLSDRLPVIGLVGNYPTNYLIGRGPVLNRRSFTLARLLSITPPFGELFSSLGVVPTCYSADRHYQSAVLLPLIDRATCIS
jgi:hypothetical protein